MLENNSQMARRRETKWLQTRGVRRKRSSKVLGLCAPNTPYNSSSFLMRVQQKKKPHIHEGVDSELGVYEYGSMADFIHLPAFSELASTNSSTPDAMLSLNFSTSAPKPSATSASANLEPFQPHKWVLQSPDNSLCMDQINNSQSVQTSDASSCSTGMISSASWQADNHVLLMKLHTGIVQALLLNCNHSYCVCNQAQLLQAADPLATSSSTFKHNTDHSLDADNAGIEALLMECLRLIQQEIPHLHESKACLYSSR